jgi:hypothetical protein
MTSEEIQSWKDLRVEICMFIKPGELFWLVPEYTNKDRAEISIDDFAKQAEGIKNILEAFPGATIQSVLKPSTSPKKTRDSF